MRKIHFIYTILVGIVFYSCQTVNVMPIDYLVPADVSFPAQIKRVGVVNNVSESPGRIEEDAALDSILLTKTNGFFERYTLNGDPQIATEALAEAIAAENYFDEVIICDSTLQVSGTSKQAPVLSKEEVNELINELEVDMLISLEQIQFKVQRQVFPMPDIGLLGVVDTKVYPKVSLYIANRNTPLIMINGSDSIFWEDFKNTVSDARTKVISDEQLITEASDFAGNIPVKHMTPQWKTANRFFYANGSPAMRDAALFAQNNNWDRALPLWEKTYESSKGKKKAQAASNISLYYEIKDDLDKADEWGQKALEQIKAVYKIPMDSDNAGVNPPSDYTRIYYNQFDLAERRKNFMTLKIQMDRFGDDF